MVGTHLRWTETQSTRVLFLTSLVSVFILIQEECEFGKFLAARVDSSILRKFIHIKVER